MNLDKAIDRLLSVVGIGPVLIDVGASGAPPRIWRSIGRYSTYVGFDPDLREIHEISDGVFHKASMINKAVTCEEGNDTAHFYLTNSPYCSSTLRPHTRSLANFLYSDLFEVQSECAVPAVTLNAIVDQLCLPRVDWFKTDSQGTDLRLFKSMREPIRTKVLGVDIEPGLIDAYFGEDLFIEAHRYLTKNGFWLSDLNVKGAVRMRRSTLRELSAFDKAISAEMVESCVKRSPGWCEARYFRSLETMSQHGFDSSGYVLLWVFAVIDNQLGFALDVAVEYERLFGKDDLSQLMINEPVSCISKLGRRRGFYEMLRSMIPLPVRQRINNLLGSVASRSQA